MEFNNRPAEKVETTTEVELTEIQKKINKAKSNKAIVDQIEKLEKEIAKLQANITRKEAKIEELGEQL